MQCRSRRGLGNNFSFLLASRAFGIDERNQKREVLWAPCVLALGRLDDEIQACSRERDFGKKLEDQKQLRPTVEHYAQPPPQRDAGHKDEDGPEGGRPQVGPQGARQPKADHP